MKNHSLKISSVYPNPFNSIAKIRYDLNSFAFVNIRIVDLQGRIIDKLIHNNQYPGNYSIFWDASSFSSGVYFVDIIVNMRSDNQIYRELKKILYLK